MDALQVRGRLLIDIEKRLPVQGGLGGASGNAVAALLALQRALRKYLSGPGGLRIASEVGSDLPLFLIGGTVLGVGRGEEVYQLPDLPAMPCVIALPEVAVSTPQAFAEWDRVAALQQNESEKQVPRLQSSFGSERASALEMTTSREIRVRTGGGARHSTYNEKLTPSSASDRMLEFGREISAWLSAGLVASKPRRSGVSARGGGRAENPLLDLVRTGIENDFEKVVFPQYPELLEVKRVLERSGARYASLSGSGSAIYGLFESKAKAEAAARKLEKSGTRALVSSTLTRRQYWKKLLAISS
jgi:4-diphosphocytidyl-2-C-methyl-D-erythritol kinase